MSYVTVSALKAYLGITASTDDGLLATVADAADAIIDRHTHRTFAGGTVATAKYFDAVEDVDGSTLYLDTDLCSITSITNGDGNALGTADYVTRPKTAPYNRVVMRSDSTAAWTYTSAHENAIAISGVWAYSATPPDDIVMAATRLAAFLYRQKDNHADADRAVIAGDATILPVAMPEDVRTYLRPYRKSTFP